MADIPLKTTADIRAAKALNKELGKTDEQLEKITKRAKGAEGAAQRLARQADPQKRYNEQMAKLAIAVKQGGLEIKDAQVQAAKYQRQLEGVGRTGTATSRGIISSASQMIAGYASVTRAVSAWRAELEAVAQLQERTTQAKLTAHGARRNLLRNLGGVDAADREFVRSSADSIASRNGYASTLVDAAMAAAVSSNPDPRQAVRATRTLLPMVDDLGGQEAGQFIGAVGDVGNALNTNNIYRSLGLLQATVSTGRPTDIRAVAMNAPRVLTAYAAEGIDPRRAAGVFAGMTVGGADPHGEISRTAAINMLGKSKAFFAADSRGYAAGAVDTPDEQLDVLMSNPALAKKFIDEMGFRAAGMAGVQALLLNPEGKAREAYNRTMNLSGNAQQQEALGREALAFALSGDQERTYAQNRVVAAGAEQLRLRDPNAPLSMENKQNFIDYMITTDPNVRRGSRWSGEARAMLWARYGDSISPSEALQAYESRVSQLEAEPRLRPDETPSPRSYQSYHPEFATQTQEHLELLREQVELLRRQVEVTEGQGGGVEGGE